MSSMSIVTDACVYYCCSSVQAICGFKNPHIQQRRIWQDITVVGKNGQQGPVHQSPPNLNLNGYELDTETAVLIDEEIQDRSVMMIGRLDHYSNDVAGLQPMQPPDQSQPSSPEEDVQDLEDGVPLPHGWPPPRLTDLVTIVRLRRVWAVAAWLEHQYEMTLSPLALHTVLICMHASCQDIMYHLRDDAAIVAHENWLPTHGEKQPTSQGCCVCHKAKTACIVVCISVSNSRTVALIIALMW